VKALVFILGVAVTLASSVQFTTAAERHHQTKSDRVVVKQPSRTSDAYAAWPAPSYGYASGYDSGGYSAPAGR
jgi:uncharacterized membrane protein